VVGDCYGLDSRYGLRRIESRCAICQPTNWRLTGRIWRHPLHNCVLSFELEEVFQSVRMGH